MGSGEITRDRRRAAAPGMTGPLGIEDATTQRSMSEVQAALDDLYSRFNALKSTPAAAGNAYDDTGLVRRVRIIERDVADLDRRVRALERKFPIVRYARVAAVHDDYLDCVFYDPFHDIASVPVSVAKPHALRVTPFDGATLAYFDGSHISYSYVSAWERAADNGDDVATETLTPYFLGEVLAVCETAPAISDGAGAIIRWEDMNLAGRNWGGGGGGGNLKVYYGATEAELVAQSPSETYAIGFAITPQIVYDWTDGTWRRSNKFRPA